MRKKILVVLKGYPRLSETFIAQELLGLEKAGFDLTLISMRKPTDKKRHPVHDEIKARVVYRGPIKAPIAQGQEIAQLVVDAGDGTTQTLPLVAKEAVAEGGFFARLWNGFLSFFS